MITAASESKKLEKIALQTKLTEVEDKLKELAEAETTDVAQTEHAKATVAKEDLTKRLKDLEIASEKETQLETFGETLSEVEEKLKFLYDVEKASKEHQKAFKELLEFAVNQKRNANNDKYTSAGAKDAIAGVLEKNGITHRTILMWLVLSVLIIVLTFVLINFAQLAFAAPGLVSSSLSAILCASSSFGVNKSFEKQSTSKKKSSATTKHAGDDLKRHWQTK
eukprot:Stramenopile-MAST_4_protein_6537